MVDIMLGGYEMVRLYVLFNFGVVTMFIHFIEFDFVTTQHHV